MAKKDLEKVLEALLFASDKPLPAVALAGIVEVPVKEVEAAIDAMNIKFREADSPILIKQIAGGYEFLTHPDYAPYIKKLYKNRILTRLSKPALEVLSIIAYKQPITKQEVELIRGVNSDGVYHTLLERKLIKIAGRKDAPGRPLLYGTTKEFFQYLGVNGMDDLPRIEEIKSILEKDESVENWDEKVLAAKNQGAFDFGQSEIMKAKLKSEEMPEQTSEEEIKTEEKGEEKIESEEKKEEDEK